MIETIRRSFNANFHSEQYDSLIREMKARYPGALDFRVAETPVFLPKAFKDQMIDTCEYIIDLMTETDLLKKTAVAIPNDWTIPGNEGNPDFIAFDFGVCLNEENELSPQLIELQGFPTLFGYQILLDKLYRSHFQIDEKLSPYLSGLNELSYVELLRKTIVGDHPPQEVVLLEILPHQQKTRIDFYSTQELLSIPVVCLTDIILHNGQLFYERDGMTHPIRRIYNRIIFDELEQQTEPIRAKGRLLTEATEVEWCPHPHCFYRISKFLLPYLRHPNIPATFFLNEVKQIPADLENYVLKPLFSFAGQGVIIDPTPSDLEQIPDPSNWILQRKVPYASVIPTPDDPAKVEIRIFYCWPPGADRPIPTMNLARISKGKMVGTRYNKDRTWVGGSICYFES